jgi:hypothetical protein
MNKQIALFELVLASALMYNIKKVDKSVKPIIYITSAYLLFGAYMNITNRVKIVK